MVTRRVELADLAGPGTAARQRADTATIASLWTLTLLLLPARLVYQGVPLSITPASSIALALGLMWACAHFSNRLGLAKGRTPVRTALFVHAVAMIATYGYGTYAYLPADELGLADHAFILIMANIVFALAVCDGVRGMDRLDRLLRTVVVGGAVIALVGAFQFLLDLDLTRYLDLPGLRSISDDAAVIERSGLRRVSSTAAHPIEFGVLCAMILPIAAYYGFRARERGEPALRWWLCAGLVAAGLMFSVSRSAVLGLAGVAVVLLCGWPARRRIQTLVVAVVFLAGIRVVAPGLLGAFYGLFANAGNDDSIRYRTHDYAVAAEEIARHPWLGRGAGTWYAPKHQVFDNQYILSTVETGYIGVTTLVLAFLVAIYAALRARRIGADAGTRDLGLTLAACLVVPLIGAATFDLMSFKMVAGLSFLLIGVAGALLRTASATASASGAASGAATAGTR
ncbi:hypothetical protein Misp01_39240 [Microtetraspora sp. NBRC 13810]|nr:hypothetical protein Misp01_39240 [Microtetraspora sp. NBRC 13810]